MKELETDLELLGSLSDVLDRKPETGDDGKASNILDALWTMGDKTSINFILAGAAIPPGETIDQSIERISLKSGVRWRKVRLEKDWKKYDSGHLLIIDENNNAFVASFERDGYLLYSASNKRLLDQSKKFERGYIFYKSFGNESVSFRKLIKLSMFEVKDEITGLVVCNAVIGLLSLFLPLMIGVIFQWMLPQSNISQLYFVIGGLLVTTIGITIFQYYHNRHLLKIESKLNNYLQSALWDKLLEQPIMFFKGYTAAQITQRALGINHVRQLITGPTIAAVIGSVVMFFYLGLLLYYSVPLALLSIGLIIFFSTVNFILLKKEIKYQNDMFTHNAKIRSDLVEQVNAISKIKLAAAETSAVKKWIRRFASEKKAEYTAGRFTNWVELLNIMAPLLSGLVLYTMNIYKDLGISTAVFISFHATFALFLAAGISLSSSLMNFFKAIPVFRRLQPIIAASIVAKPDPEVTDIKGNIELRNVSFSHDEHGRSILNQISLNIAPGEFIGITGPSGCGKSTLIKLLLGFFEPGTGSICIDGHDITKINMRSIRKRIGVVLQADGVMPGSILENIRGAGQYSIKEVERAVEIADLSEDIRLLPMGLNTIIPHGGGSFSGGQMQRILIARAVVGNPRVLIMDEATSALDAISQEKISNALDQLSCTRIVIAHRLSTLRGANRIFEFRNGQLIDKQS